MCALFYVFVIEDRVFTLDRIRTHVRSITSNHSVVTSRTRTAEKKASNEPLRRNRRVTDPCPSPRRGHPRAARPRPPPRATARARRARHGPNRRAVTRCARAVGNQSVLRSRWWEASSRAAVTLARAVCVEETRWFPVLTRRAAVVRDTTAPARLAGLSRDWLAARADAENADHADDGGARGPLPNDVVARLHGVGDYAADAHALFCTRRLAVR